MTANFFQKVCFRLPHWIGYVTRWSQFQMASLTVGQSVIATSLVVTGLVMGVRQTALLQPLELTAFDFLLRLQPPAPPDPRLLIVEITEADLAAQNQWPFTDQTFAQAIANLQEHQPKVIGLDLYRNIQHPPGYEALQKELRSPNLITIYKLEELGEEGVPGVPGALPEQMGFNDLMIDRDNVVRRNFIYGYQGEEEFYSLALRLSLAYLSDRNLSLQVEPDALQLGGSTFVPLERTSGGYQDLDARGYQVLINYRSRPEVAQRITLTQVLQGTFDPAWVKDKVVLIGSTAPSLKDAFLTPYSTTEKANAGMIPGVVIHAHQTSQILSTVLDQQPLFWFWPNWGELLWIGSWSLVGGVLVWRLQHPVGLSLAGMGAVSSLVGVCWVVFTQAGWIPLIPALAALGLTSGGVVFYKLFHHTFCDPLSGLPNRTLFLKYLQGAIASNQTTPDGLFGVLFLNLDRFKVINDSLGHQAGDQLLIKAGRRLREGLRHRGILARIGGDEFAILLDHVQDVHELTAIADYLRQHMTHPFVINGQEVFTSISIGIALSQSNHHHQPEDVLRDAHTALYRAKTLGKSRHEIFANGMRTQVVNRLRLETDLHRALEQQEFQLYYQPIISLHDTCVTGFEALIRWQHPEHGFIPPSNFIPVAEEIGLIIPLGQWILQAACRQLSHWQAQFPSASPLVMSVNLSSQQFGQPDLVESIEQVLQTLTIADHSLKLEITESIAMSDIEATITLLVRLKALKLGLSIDDFGTGYSSLSYLHRFPIDTLKIDRSFVSRMVETSEDAAIVQTIIMLAHALGMDVVAEGVETVAQQEKLHSLTCEYAQGYLFSHPLDSAAATALLVMHHGLLAPPTERESV